MKLKALLFCLLPLACFTACQQTGVESSDGNPHAKTPVTVITVQSGSLSESIRLSATSAYQKKNQVKAIATGYIQQCNVRLGQFVQAGTTLYLIRTKEADALAKFHASDTAYKVKGILPVRAPESGIVTEVNKFANDYAAEGDPLLIIAQQNSLVFILSLPFELKKYAAVGTPCSLLLPDSLLIAGTISALLSTVDPVSQTQLCEIHVPIAQNFPENLLASVLIPKSTKHNAQIVPKSCVLADETLQNFWVMKLINDTTAVRIPVSRGIADQTSIEILSPRFAPNDRLIQSGHYGLSDTAFVKINK